MLHATTAADIEKELPTAEELKGPSYGFQVQQVSEAELAAGFPQARLPSEGAVASTEPAPTVGTAPAGDFEDPD